MNPVNIVRVGERSTYRLLRDPIELTCKVTPVLEAPGTDQWEDDGGACAPELREETTRFMNKSRMRLRGSRKQTAARAHRLIETSTVVVRDGEKVPSPTEVRPAALMQDVRTARLGQNIHTGAKRTKRAKLRAEVKPPVRNTQDPVLKKIEELEARIVKLAEG